MCVTHIRIKSIFVLYTQAHTHTHTCPNYGISNRVTNLAEFIRLSVIPDTGTVFRLVVDCGLGAK